MSIFTFFGHNNFEDKFFINNVHLSVKVHKRCSGKKKPSPTYFAHISICISGKLKEVYEL